MTDPNSQVNFNPWKDRGKNLNPEARQSSLEPDKRNSHASDGPMTMLGLALLGAGLVGVCLIAGYFGLWVWR
jgi:hypothetical protein